MSSTGEITSDKSKLMECWVDHYNELYGGTNSFSPSGLDKLERLPMLLVFDFRPDGIPDKVFK